MNKFLQISSYIVSFILVFWMGIFFQVLITGEVYYLNRDMPLLPGREWLQFFIKNHNLISYLFLLPWLGFIGFPFFLPRHISYWDSNFFLLRFSVFLPIQIFLITYFASIIILPWIQVLHEMSKNGPPPLTGIEITVRVFFWLSALTVLGGFFVRLWKNVRSRDR